MPHPKPETALADHLFAVFSTWILPILVLVLYGITLWYSHIYYQTTIHVEAYEGLSLYDVLRRQQDFSFFASFVSLACQFASWLYGRPRKRLYLLIVLAVVYAVLALWLGQDPHAGYGG